MAHIMILKRDRETGRLLLLLHKRGYGVREGGLWGIPGGGLDREERFLLQDDLMAYQGAILRRAALRETLEEAGGGKLVRADGVACESQRVQIGGVQEANLRPLTFQHIIIPPGLLQIVDHPNLCKRVLARYKSNKTTSVFIYVMSPENDAEYIAHWKPRATPHSRWEICENYIAPNCKNGYLWVDFEYVANNPLRPVETSEKPLCEFLVNMMSDSYTYLMQSIYELENNSISQDVLVCDTNSIDNIEKGVYIRLRLDYACHDRIEQLTRHIQQRSNGIFYSQLDHRSGLGCHPFHITLASSLWRSSLTYCDLLQNDGILDSTSQSFRQTITSFLNQNDLTKLENKLNFMVSSNGRVSIKVYDTSHCLGIGQHISSLIVGCNGWYTEREENLHITIGRLSGNITTGCKWLNANFSLFFGNDPSAYSIRCDAIEVSEECTSELKRSFLLRG